MRIRFTLDITREKQEVPEYVIVESQGMVGFQPNPEPLRDEEDDD